MIKVLQFQALHFKSADPERPEVILLYALGDDGIIYEFAGQWLALPIEPEFVKKLPSETQFRDRRSS